MNTFLLSSIFLALGGVFLGLATGFALSVVLEEILGTRRATRVFCYVMVACILGDFSNSKSCHRFCRLQSL